MRLAEANSFEDLLSDCFLRGATSRELIALATRDRELPTDESGRDHESIEE